jgi:hypothetical protein
MDGSPCPKCWVSVSDIPLADLKGMFADLGLSLDPRHDAGPATPDGEATDG